MKNVAEIVQDALGVSTSEITNIETMGGMTNINYKVTVKNEQYIVRIPGLGTDQLINREEEKKNLELGVALGINPEHIYINPKSGVKITRLIPNAITLTSKTTKEEAVMRKVTTLFRKLHNSEVKMGNQFNLYNLMVHYENKAYEENAQFYAGFEEVKKEVEQVKSVYDLLGRIEKPCHIDSLYENFIIDADEKVYLIDWEYSGMFDPLWDLATHMMESAFNAQEEAHFLHLYFQREASEEERKIILIHKIFQDYLWSIWTLFKEAKGDEFGSYGQDRFDRLSRNLLVFKVDFANGLSI